MKPFLTVVFASHADSKICGHTKMFRWQMIIIVRSCSIPIFLEKESGVCRLECFIVFEGILFEFGKTVRILSRIFWVYVARAWITQDIIVHSTCAYPYSGKFGREYVPFCAVFTDKFSLTTLTSWNPILKMWTCQDTTPFLLIVSPTPPVQSVDA